MQTTSHLLMIRPAKFSFNEETAINNSFQSKENDEKAHDKALKEFDEFVNILRKNGVDVTVIKDTALPYTPDSIFPNNWVSFHNDGTVCLYPMYALNRRLERKSQVLQAISDKFEIKRKVDLTFYEDKNLFLEGTGSMVLDRENKIAFACISPRTDIDVLNEFSKLMDYYTVVFHSVDEKERPIYHTNVMMCIADHYAVVCLESLPIEEEKEKLVKSLEGSGKELIEISFEQMNHFAGNMLQVNNNKNEKLLIMSSQAYHSLNGEQLSKIQAFNRILHSPLYTIERNGGGSARCMIAEVHLPLN